MSYPFPHDDPSQMASCNDCGDTWPKCDLSDTGLCPKCHDADLRDQKHQQQTAGLTGFPHASRSFLELNPHLARAGVPSPRPAHETAPADAVRPQLEQRPAAGAPRPKRAKAEDSKRFLVRVTSIRGRLIDEDNLCEKYVVDCCRYSGLIPGDGPGKTKIEVCQRKAGEGEDEHTLVEVFEVL